MARPLQIDQRDYANLGRFDLTDEQYHLIRTQLTPERTGRLARHWRPHRPTIDGMLLIFRTGAGGRR